MQDGTPASSADGIWEIKIEAKDVLTGAHWDTSTYPCTHGDFAGQSINNVIVRLDNTLPKGEITIDFLSDSDFIVSGGT